MGHVRNGELVTGSSEVVGVVEDVRNHSLTSEGRAQVYVPWEQSTRSPLTFVVRSSADPMSLVPTIRKLLAAERTSPCDGEGSAHDGLCGTTA